MAQTAAAVTAPLLSALAGRAASSSSSSAAAALLWRQSAGPCRCALAQQPFSTHSYEEEHCFLLSWRGCESMRGADGPARENQTVPQRTRCCRRLRALAACFYLSRALPCCSCPVLVPSSNPPLPLLSLYYAAANVESRLNTSKAQEKNSFCTLNWNKQKNDSSSQLPSLPLLRRREATPRTWPPTPPCARAWASAAGLAGGRV